MKKIYQFLSERPQPDRIKILPGNKGKVLFVKAIILAGFAFCYSAVAQSNLGTITGGSVNVSTQPVSGFLLTNGNWYHASPPIPTVITGLKTLISAESGPFEYGNGSSFIHEGPGSGGNKVIFPGDQPHSSLTVSNLNLSTLANPVLAFNLLLLSGNGNPVFKAKFTGSFGEVLLTLPVTASNTWTPVVVPVPVGVTNAVGPVTLTFERNGGTTGANGAHFWAIDDIIIENNPGVCLGPPMPANTFRWVGAGTDAPGGNTNFNDPANWCPQPISVNVLSGANLQLFLTESATITLDENSLAASIEATISGNNNYFVLDLNGHNLTIASDLRADVTSGNPQTKLEIKTGAGKLSVKGSTLIANNTIKGMVGFGSAPNMGMLSFNGPVNFGAMAGIFDHAPADVYFKNALINNSAEMATVGFSGSNVTFNGNASQIISGSKDLSIGNLRISNPYGVSSTAINLLVSGEVNMVAGVLTTSEQKQVKLGAEGTLIEGDYSYVSGGVHLEPRSISSSPQNFGNIGISITAASGPYETTVTRITGEQQTISLVGSCLSVHSVQPQSAKRMFTISVNNPPANLGATLTFNFWDHELGGLLASQLVLLREDPQQPNSWINRGRDQGSLAMPTANTPGSISLSGIAAFSTWTLGEAANPLPVELLWFRAERYEHAGLLEWATAYEQKNAGFQIEACNDNYNYETIGFINAQANTNHQTEYSFIDHQPNRRGVRYYRLIQHDLDGKKNILGVRTVNFEATGTSLVTSPNPFSYGFTALVETDQKQTAQITLTDAIGKVVLSQETELEKGINQLDFTGRELKKGMYVLSMHLEKEVLTTKVHKH